MSGRLTPHILAFCRGLRQAGIPIGTGQILEAVAVLAVMGLTQREDVYWALHAALITHRRQTALFDQAFTLFWRNPQILERLVDLAIPPPPAALQNLDTDELAPRLSPAIRPEAPPRTETITEIDLTAAFSATERLHQLDFEKMTLEELAAAKALITGMRLDQKPIPTRRYRPSTGTGRIDPRASLRASLRNGGDLAPLRRRTRRFRSPALVILCDISGSMSRYSRIFLHFLHAVTQERDRVQVFLFGARLTLVTRQLRGRDVDLALDHVAERVADWSGGTRIAACLDEFNHLWARRMLGQGATVLLMTDGLDRDGGTDLGPIMARLRQSCHRLVWLNPLLRWSGFQPLAAGIRAMLPEVDEFRPVHNLTSLADLAAALAAPVKPRAKRAFPLAEIGMRG